MEDMEDKKTVIGSVDEADTEQQQPVYDESQNIFEHLFYTVGRIGRLEYAITFVVYIVLSFVISMISDGSNDYSTKLLCLPVSLVVWWIFIAQGAKRCHDRGNTGLYLIIPFYFLWILFAKGDSEENYYGPVPTKMWG